MDARARNRALLARQLLLARVSLSPVRAVERLVGMQAQTPRSPYTALWSRLHPFDPMSLSRAIETRRLVRIALMRSTIHLVSAKDAMLLRPLVVPILMRELTSTTWGPLLAGLDLHEVAAEARRVLEQEPRTPAKLGAALAEVFPDREPRALAHAARTLLPLVQIPPRALWQRSGATTLATAEQWLGRAVRTDATWDEVALRYLAAFGPATAADLVAWSRVTGLAEVFARLRPQLRVLRDERGRELFDLPRAPRPPASVEAPPRFLPDFDNVLLSHADRSRIVPDGIGDRIYKQFGHWSPLLVDGRLRGTWKLDRGAATLSIELGDKLTKAERAAVEEEGARLLEFAAGGGTIRFVE